MTEIVGAPELRTDRDYSIDIGLVLPSQGWEQGHIPTDEEVVEEIFARLGYSDYLNQEVSMGGKTVAARDFHELYPEHMVAEVKKSRKIMRAILLLDRTDGKKSAIYANKMKANDFKIRTLLFDKQS